MNIKEFGYDKLVQTIKDNRDTEYINGIIDLVNEVAKVGTEEAKPETPKKKAASSKKTDTKPGRPVKTKLDMGKVGALRNAGWSWEKVGEEFGVSAATVYQHWKAYENSKDK